MSIAGADGMAVVQNDRFAVATHKVKEKVTTPSAGAMIC